MQDMNMAFNELDCDFEEAYNRYRPPKGQGVCPYGVSKFQGACVSLVAGSGHRANAGARFELVCSCEARD